MRTTTQCSHGFGALSALLLVAVWALASSVAAQIPDWCPTEPIPVCADGPGPVCATLVVPGALNVQIDGATWTNGTFCFQADSSGSYLFHVTADMGEFTLECDVTVEVGFGTAPQIICPDQPYQLFLCAPGKVCFTVPSKNASKLQAAGAEMTDSTLCVQVDSSGVYSVVIIASNACGFDTCTVTAVVTIGSKPVVGCIDSIFNVDICEFSEICVPFPVTGADEVTTSLGYWNDGQLCFTPDTAGYYIISVTGTNSCGSSTCGASVLVIKHDKPAIIVPFTPPTATICSPGRACVPCLITGADDVEVSEGEWSNDTLCLNADTAGFYTVSVNATNQCGTSTVEQFGLYVEIVGLPVLSCPSDTPTVATCDSELCIASPVTTSNADSMTITGGFIHDSQLCFIAGQTGLYAFTATAYNACGETSCTFFVQVTRNLSPFVHCPLVEQSAQACQPGDEVCLDLMIDNADLVTVSGATNARWTDGRLCFVTDSATTYSVSVTASNECGTAECALFVNVSFTPAPHITCPADSLYVQQCGDGDVCVDLPIANADGVFLDGASWDNDRLCFSAPEPGRYEFEVVALGACVNDTCEVIVYVESGAAPTINCWQEDPELYILCSPGEICRPIGDRITGATSIEVLGGSYADGQLCFMVDTAGMYYGTTVIASNECGADTCTFWSQVEFTTAPEACFTVLQGDRPLEVKFENCVADPFRAGYRWNFGDNDFFYTDSFSPTHQYAAPGCYAVTMIAGNSCGIDTLIDTVCVADSQLVVPTDQWISIYCTTPTYNGIPLQSGDVIAAYDPQGVLCGMDVARADGSVGFLPIYRDDQFSPEDEGADPGDLITFAINGQPAYATPPVIWTGMGDRIEACQFGVEDCQQLHLKQGWNLVSWNVAYQAEIASALQNIAACVDVVLGFDRGGLTYDPVLPQYSTLERLDYHMGFWFKMKCDATLDLCGTAISPEDIILLYQGWNLVGYWPTDTLAVETGFASILTYMHLAYTFDNAILLWQDTQPQFNTLTELRPGLGYWLRCEVNGALAYPGFGVGGRLNTAGDPTADVTPSRTWMSIYGSDLQVDGVELTSGTVIEAFTAVGIKCGEGTYENGLLRFMPVYGYDDVAMPMRLYPAAGEPVTLRIGGVRVYPDLIMQAGGSRLKTENFSLTPTAVADEDLLPRHFALDQNYPNPFNPTTVISFELPVATPVRIELYNALGQRIRTLVNGTYHAGRHMIQWDATDGAGNPVAGGVYIYRLQAGAYTESRKMLLVK